MHQWENTKFLNLNSPSSCCSSPACFSGWPLGFQMSPLWVIELCANRSSWVQAVLGPQRHLLSLSLLGTFPFLPPPPVGLWVLPYFLWIYRCLWILTGSGEDRLPGVRKGPHTISEQKQASVLPYDHQKKHWQQWKTWTSQSLVGRAAYAARLQPTMWSKWTPIPVLSFLSALCGHVPPAWRVQASLLSSLSSLFSSMFSICPPTRSPGDLQSGHGIEKPNSPSHLSTSRVLFWSWNFVGNIVRETHFFSPCEIIILYDLGYEHIKLEWVGLGVWMKGLH